MKIKEIEILKRIKLDDLYIPIMWPEIQDLMNLEGFHDSSYLINDDKGMDDFGSSAYMINFKWLVENGWY